MKDLNQKLTKAFGLLLLLTIVVSACKKTQTDPFVASDSNLAGTMDGMDLSVAASNLSTTYYTSAGDNTSSLLTTAALDASGTALTFFIPDVSTGTVSITPKLGTSSNPGNPGLKVEATTATTSTTTQAYVVYVKAGNTYYAISGTVSTTVDGTKATVKWTITFKDATGRTFTSTGSFVIANYKAVVKPKTEVKDPTPVSLKPTIDNVSSTVGLAGDTITITGTNFSTTLADNVVKFNGVAGVVKTATATKLTVVTPQAGTNGPITVKVANSETATGPTYTFLGHPTITGITPATGRAGDAVAIAGTNFSPIAAENSVRFNGVAAVITEATNTVLRVTVPAGVTTGLVTVAVRSQIAAAGVNTNVTFTVVK